MTMKDEPEPFLSYSVNNEDIILNRLFREQKDGFYVDVGAAHPLFENDTRALYERGWSGINIEPTADFYRELVAQRPRDLNLNVAVSDEPGELVFHEIVGTGLSTGDPDGAARAEAKGFEVIRRIVPTWTLRHILQQAAAPVIDLLKVDVEGYELKVMRSNDWDRFRPRIIVAEGTFPESPIRRPDGVAEYLAAQGYQHVYFDGLNDFYAERDLHVPAGAFASPPNIFDRFVPFAYWELIRAKASLASEVAKLQQERENATGYIASLVDELKRRDDGRTALSAQLRRTELAAEAQSVDLNRAKLELIAMRERCQALALELDAASMTTISAAVKPQAKEDDPITQQLERVYASRSWRITRPLRALARPRRALRLLLSKIRD